MEMSLSKLLEMVKDREAWNAAVLGIADSDMTEGLSNDFCIIYYWCRAGLQCCVSFCCTVKQISYTYTYIHSFFFFFQFAFHLGHHRALSGLPGLCSRFSLSDMDYHLTSGLSFFVLVQSVFLCVCVCVCVRPYICDDYVQYKIQIWISKS